jgi:Dinucleotide-utilizing enzymes involved in molybdopterin and thiamine biosynthesis family 2
MLWNRLWGVHGQKILIESKICLLSCEPAGVETVKNLILPGVGSITIVDHNQVQDRDLGNNFFVTEEDIGKNRCDVKMICYPTHYNRLSLNGCLNSTLMSEEKQ